MRYLDDCPTDLLERSRVLVDNVRRMTREECAEELREMAAEFPHAVRIVLRLAAERLVGG
jgi:hypothetical protein